MDQLKAHTDALGPLLPERNVLFELGVEVSHLFGSVAHPQPFEVFRDAILAEPCQAKAAKSVKADALDVVQNAQDISLLQRFVLCRGDEVARNARDITSKFPRENLGNVHDAHGVDSFRLLLLASPNAATNVEDAAIRPEVGWAQGKSLADPKSGTRKKRKQHHVFAVLYGRQNLL